MFRFNEDYANVVFRALISMYNGLWLSSCKWTNISWPILWVCRCGVLLQPEILNSFGNICRAFLFGFLLFAFSCVHGYYILTNTTTIESISDRPYYIRVDFDRTGHNHQIVTTDIGEKLWSHGFATNWRSVMGNSVAGWFCKSSSNSMLYYCSRIDRKS